MNSPFSQLQILPLVKGSIRRHLMDALSQGSDYAFCPLPRDITADSEPGEILHSINNLSRKPHIVLWQLNQTVLEKMESWNSSDDISLFSDGVDKRGVPAIIAVFEDASGQDVMRAANLDFDGFLMPPFVPEIVEETLIQSLQRNRKKLHLIRRYRKMRSLCRLMNGKRRQLRHKVDLLCNDLVHSNMQISSSLSSLQKAYDFQGDLLGEYDLQYLLFKSLQEMKKSLPNTAAAVYLCRTAQFEAHLEDLSGLGIEMEQMETSLENAIIKRVLRLKKNLNLTSHIPLMESSAECDHTSSPLAILSLPIRYAKEIIAVLVFYRSAEHPYTRREETAILPYLPSLGRAIAGLQRLQEYIRNIE